MLPFSVTFFLRSIFSHCRSSRQIGFVVFFVGSVLSTAAQNMPMVLVGRGLSGVGAAFMLVVSTLSLSACNASSLFRLLARLSVLSFRTIALSLLIHGEPLRFPSSLASATVLVSCVGLSNATTITHPYCSPTGPIIGGALVSVNFRWIFAINLPVRSRLKIQEQKLSGHFYANYIILSLDRSHRLNLSLYYNSSPITRTSPRSPQFATWLAC